MGTVSKELLLPIVGRGSGKDTVDKEFYRGVGLPFNDEDFYSDGIGMFATKKICEEGITKFEENVIKMQGVILEDGGGKRAAEPGHSWRDWESGTICGERCSWEYAPFG